MMVYQFESIEEGNLILEYYGDDDPDELPRRMSNKLYSAPVEHGLIMLNGYDKEHQEKLVLVRCKWNETVLRLHAAERDEEIRSRNGIWLIREKQLIANEISLLR